MHTETFTPLPVELIDLARITIPDTYQRGQRPRIVQTIIDNFDPALAGVLFVAGPIAKGMYRCWDGGHRLVAMRELGIAAWNCQVGEANQRAEADLFDTTNTVRTKPRPWEHHKARLTAKNDVAETIDRYAREAGWTIIPDGDTPRITSATALYSIADRWSLDVLHLTLAIVTAAWGHDKDAVSMPIMRGVAAFVGKHPDVEHVELVDKIKLLGARAYWYRAKARYSEAVGGTYGGDVYRYTVDVWNEGRRGRNRLQAV